MGIRERLRREWKELTFIISLIVNLYQWAVFKILDAISSFQPLTSTAGLRVFLNMLFFLATVGITAILGLVLIRYYWSKGQWHPSATVSSLALYIELPAAIILLLFAYLGFWSIIAYIDAGASWVSYTAAPLALVEGVAIIHTALIFGVILLADYILHFNGRKNSRKSASVYRKVTSV